METRVLSAQPCYSAALAQPFARLLKRNLNVPIQIRSSLDNLESDARIPVKVMHELLQGAVLLANDPDIGLKAARELQPGDCGALEYAARSASTWREACYAVGRYMRLLNDALKFQLRVDGDREQIVLESDLPLPRAAADFQSAAFYVCAAYFRPSVVPELEVWFTHPQPDDASEYERTFGRDLVRFEAPFNGFVMPYEYMDWPVASADPKLHDLIQEVMEAELVQLPQATLMAMQVREVVACELQRGIPSQPRIAKRLGLGARTLARRLEQEGITFKQLVDEVRRELALRYLGQSSLSISDVTHRLRFADPTTFHRAFRRWTGATPNAYRRAHRVVG